MDRDIKALKEYLENLRTDKLKSFTYEETVSVVEKLEAVCIEDNYLIESIEFVDTCLGHAKDIDDKIKNNEFNNCPPTKAKKSSLQSRVKALMHSFATSIHVSLLLLDRSEEVELSLKKQQSEFLDQLSAQKEEIETKLKETKELILNEFNTSKEDIETKLQNTKDLILKEFNFSKEEIEKNIRQEFDKQKEKASELEHTTLTHVLSLMGIFSAVITIIMSVVLTSTSWLNNAEGPSAVLAFLIPNLVSLFAVVVLLSFIYLYTHRNTKNNSDNSDKPKRVIVAYVAISAVLLIAVLLTAITLAYILKNNKPHSQYVIFSSEYEVIEKDITNGENTRYFVFELDEIRYEFEYDESYLHGDNLYFCKEHNSLE